MFTLWPLSLFGRPPVEPLHPPPPKPAATARLPRIVTAPVAVKEVPAFTLLPPAEWSATTDAPSVVTVPADPIAEVLPPDVSEKETTNT